MAPVTNGSTRSKPSRSNSNDPAYPAPTARINNLTKTVSGGNSPADSVVDLYSGGRSANNSAANGIDHGRKRNSMGVFEVVGPEMDEDDPGWIHRDKLARIESRELQAAGIVLPRTRAYSRQGARSNRSRETSANGLGRSDRGQQKRQKIETQQDWTPEEPDTQQDPSYTLSNVGIISDNTNAGDDPSTWDLRTPEEIAADSYLSQGEHEYRSLSKGASKIPINMQSAVPIPLDYLERDAPVKRAKSAVWGREAESFAYPHPVQVPKAAFEETVQPPLEEPMRSATVGAKPGSPKKNGTGRPATRKTSAPLSGKQPPVSSTSNTSSRPKTRSGSNASRPVTRSGEIKALEGDPPWLATMYKPDPRLPPDQQLLPTVAKRMMQERMEREGKAGDMYDTQFRVVREGDWGERPDPAIEMEPKESPPPPNDEPRGKEEPLKDGSSNQWPLKSPQLSPGENNGRPGTSGGYSTMPRISTVPPAAQLKSPQLQQGPVQRVPVMEMEEGKKKKGGCGCCLVM